MTRAWILACVAAEATGITAAAVAARGADAIGAGHAGTAGWALLVIVAGGLVEGTALGALQARALAEPLGRTGRRRWVAATVLVAGIGWTVGSAPATLAADDGPGGAAAPGPIVVALSACALGIAMGALLGLAQGWAAVGSFRHPWRWVLVSTAGWAAAMPVIFLGATAVGAGWPLPAVAAAGAATGATAGLVLGGVTGPFLVCLDGPRVRDRLVLVLLGVSGRPRGLAAIRYRAPRSGRLVSFPVAVAPTGETAEDVVVLVGHAQHKQWWRAVGAASDIEVLLGRTWVPAQATVLRSGDDAWAAARAAYAQRWPRVPVADDVLVRLRTRGQDQGPGSAGTRAVGHQRTGS